MESIGSMVDFEHKTGGHGKPEITINTDFSEVGATLPLKTKQATTPIVEHLLSPMKSIMSDDVLDGREAEKVKASAVQRENYLQTPLQHSSGGLFSKCFSFYRTMFTDVDSHCEKLYYLFAVEIFIIFVTYTHYSTLDKRNKFLTPIVMGGVTTMIGETIIQIYKWNLRRHTYRKNQGIYSKMGNDEEMQIESESSSLSAIKQKKGMSATKMNMHHRNLSNVSNIDQIETEKEQLPQDLTTFSDLESLENSFIPEHCKILAWGSLNGLLSSYWIELVISLFPDQPLYCVLMDQTIGVLINQTLYSLFLCLWDGEMEVCSGYSHKEDLTWEVFIENYAVMLWKYMKLVWMVWPFISFFSFMILPQQWIFPLNCVCTTLFTLVLAGSRG